MHQPILFLVCGIPGAGKTTFAKVLEQKHNALRLCPDEWMADLGVDLFDESFRDRLEKRLMKLAKTVLQQGSHVVIEFGSWAKEERLTLLKLAREAGAEAHLYWLDAPVPELARRVAARGGADAVFLSEAALQEISERVERPTLEEGALFNDFRIINP